MMLCLYPTAKSFDDDDALRRALTHPETVSAELRSQPENGQPRGAYAYRGSPDILFFIGEAVLTGVAGNAAYDALKMAVSRCNAKLQKLGDGGHQRLSKDDAVRLARTLLRAWDETDSRIKTVESKLDDSNRWVIVLKVDDTLQTVTIPPGPLIGAKIRVTSRDGRSALQRLGGRVAATVRRMRYRLFRR